MLTVSTSGGVLLDCIKFWHLLQVNTSPNFSDKLALSLVRLIDRFNGIRGIYHMLFHGSCPDITDRGMLLHYNHALLNSKQFFKWSNPVRRTNGYNLKDI